MIVPARGLSLAGALAAMAAATGVPYDMPVLGYDPPRHRQRPEDAEAALRAAEEKRKRRAAKRLALLRK